MEVFTMAMNPINYNFEEAYREVTSCETKNMLVLTIDISGSVLNEIEAIRA